MSLEQQDSVQEPHQFPFQLLKTQNQNTTISLKHKNTAQVTTFDFEAHITSSTQCSFEQGIYQENMHILKIASIRYLEECLLETFDKTEGFKDGSLYENLPFEVGGANQLEVLIARNQLLTEDQQYQLMKTLKQEEDLIRLAKQIIPLFGITVGKQLIYIIFHLLNFKLEKFRDLHNVKNSIIPKFSCFQGYEDDFFALRDSCSVYQDLNLQEISAFAQKQLENIYSNLYFSSHIKYLSLREVKLDTRENILINFSSLVRQISRTLFFTLAGACQPNETTSSSQLFLDLSREVSFADYPESILQRSRPSVPYDDDEPYDFLSKKMKFS